MAESELQLNIKKRARYCCTLSHACHHGWNGVFTHHTDKTLFVFLIVTFTSTCVQTSARGPITYIHNGVICMKCPTGTRVSQHCTQNFTHSSCENCKPGTYQAMTWTDLETCGICDGGCQDVNAVVVDNCTSEHNLRCECDDGYYDKHPSLGVMACVGFSKCPSGKTVVDRGGPQKDVTCGWCPSGQFFNATTDQCSNCTECANLNMTTTVICNKMTDAICNEIDQTAATPVSPMPSRDDNLDSTKIAIISVIVTVVLLGLVGGLFFYRCKKKTRENCRGTANNRSQAKEEEPLIVLPTPSDKTVWTKAVFLKLKPHRTNNWRNFLRQLPDPELAFNADIAIENSTETTDDEKLYQLLRKWCQCCYQSVTIEAIVTALKESGNDHIVKEVMKVYNDSVRSHKPEEDDVIFSDVGSHHGNAAIPEVDANQSTEQTFVKELV